MERYYNRGLTGLANLGNTCFINAFIQCLSHTHEFSDYMDTIYQEDEKNDLLNEWNSLRKLMWSKNCVISPKRFIHYIHKISKERNKIFQTYSQEDVSEFAFFILEIFNEYLNKPINYILLKDTKIEEFKRDSFKKEYSLIINLFYGIHVSAITHKNGELINETPEQFSILTLHLLNKNNNTIIKCIEDYCKNEVLENENQYTLTEGDKDKTEVKIDAERQLYFYELPKILIIILKRYRNSISKNQDIVEIEEKIDLEAFCKNGTNKYELYGINLHSGILHGGHYMAVIKNNSKWYLFNDSQLREISFDKVKNNPNVYCLFYRKIYS